MAPRILLCGDVMGRLNQLFKRVSSVNKSAGPFDALFCVGQFFPESPDQLDEFMDYIECRTQVPLPTYFIGDYGVGAPKVLLAASKDPANRGFKMDGLRVCDNLYWLKGSGKFTLLGLSVAYLSGRQSPDAQQYGVYSQDDVDALRAIAEEPGIVDLFLTNEWPSGVTNRANASDIPAGLSDSMGSDSIIAELVGEIKPRYHIAGSKGIYYAREPYSNIEAVHVTRFIGLATVGNKDKQKFIHAISPTPASTMSSTDIAMKTTNTTLSPYTFADKRTSPEDAAKRSSDSVSDSQYWRYDVSQKRRKHGAGDGDKLCFKFLSSGSCPRGEKCNFRHDLDAREQYIRGVCFDFLNKGKCERGPGCNFKHSLQDEGENDADRRPRSQNFGSNRSKECWFCLSSPNVESYLISSIGENYYCALAKGPLVEDHVLLIPVEHLPSTLSLSTESEVELSKFQNSLRMYHKNQGKQVIFFEWVSKCTSHANLQVVPIPTSKATLIEKIFNLAAEKLGFKFVSKKWHNLMGIQVCSMLNYQEVQYCCIRLKIMRNFLPNLVARLYQACLIWRIRQIGGIANIARRKKQKWFKILRADFKNLIQTADHPFNEFSIYSHHTIMIIEFQSLGYLMITLDCLLSITSPMVIFTFSRLIACNLCL